MKFEDFLDEQLKNEEVLNGFLDAAKEYYTLYHEDPLGLFSLEEETFKKKNSKHL